MKLLGLTLIICTLVCVCVGSSDDDKCYRLSPMQVSCHSSEQIHMKVIRGPPGKPGAKGKDGQPCQASQEQLKQLKVLAAGLSQGITNRSNTLNNKLAKKINTIHKLGSGLDSSHGGDGGGEELSGHNNDVKIRVYEGNRGSHTKKYQLAIKNRKAPVGVLMENGVVRYDTACFPAITSRSIDLCAERGGEMIYRNLETVQKRKEFWRKMFLKTFNNVNYMAFGIQKKGGVWYYLDGKRVNRATFGKIGGRRCSTCNSAYMDWLGQVKTTAPSSQDYLICHYPLRIKFKSPGKQNAFNNQLNFEQARVFCYNKGGRIALSSIKTNDKLRKLVKSVNIADGEYWIGVKKVGVSAWTYGYIDEYVSVDNTFPWLPNYPKFVRFTDQCVVLSVNKSTVGMINRACNTQRRVLCEFSS